MVAGMEPPPRPAEESAESPGRAFPCSHVTSVYRVGDALHLEGLNLIGELPAVHRALRALRMRLVGTTADGIADTGHVFRVWYEGSEDLARRVVADLVLQEQNARVRLREEMPRVFGDSLCRALAVLKNCRLLSPGEFFDLLSPLRLAALEKMLDGVTRREIDRCLAQTDLSSREDKLDPVDRDKIDGERADEMNRRFEDVVLNERAEEKFL
jgi:protein-arginine kinase